MAHRKCSQLDWNYDSEDEGDNFVQETVRIPHTEVNMGDLGTQSTRTSYLSAPASPAKKKTTSSNSNQHYHEGFLNHEDGNARFDEDSLPDPANIDDSDDDLNPAYTHHLADLDSGGPKAKRQPRVHTLLLMWYHLFITSQVNPLCTWLDGDRDMYLGELLRGDGCGDCWKDEDDRAGCHGCDDRERSFRCMHCYGGHLSCMRCIVGLHALNPLHCIEVHGITLTCKFKANNCPVVEW